MVKEIFKRGISVINIALKTRTLLQLDDEKQQFIARRALTNQFADARGMLMKIGQSFTSNSNNDSFDPLFKSIPAIPLVKIKPYLEQLLEQPLSNIFNSIDESKNAASLGQVHHAILLDGHEVAIKIQYPDIAEKVHAELKLFGLMPGFGPVKKWGFDLASYKKNFKENMDRELNYHYEADIQHLFKQKVTVPGLTVPAVYKKYSNANLLIQSWESGVYIDDISHWPSEDRKRVAEILLATLFKSLFEAGIVHGDPHKGNSYFRYDAEQKPEVVLMDYGCTIEISEIQRLSLLKLIIANHENIDISPLRYFVAMGFNADKLVNIGDSLPMLCRLLFKPFIEHNTFFISNWMLENNFGKLLGQRRWWFRSAGPAELFLLMRSFQGVIQQFQVLKTNVSWSHLLYTTLSPELIEKARAFSLPKLPQEETLRTSTISTLASSLRVRVSKNKQQIVNVTLPAEMVLDLESLIPEDVVLLIKNSNSLNLNDIQQKIRESGIAPQSVFNIEDNDKQYQVWLE